MKTTISKILLTAVASTALAGCMAAQDDRLEGIALSGGNAIAHNSALQIIDPWPSNVQDTDLKVPADRKSNSGKSADTGNVATQ